MRFYDAHQHLQRCPPIPGGWESLPTEHGIARGVVNGTREDDWEAVETLATTHRWLLPAFGIHPWEVANATPLWEERLLALLERHPEASVGEIGLDRWRRTDDFDLQQTLFSRQLAIAARLERPASIHCLRAWGALLEMLEAAPKLPPFLLHAYGGPPEMVATFVRLGGYFSFSPSFLTPERSRKLTPFRHIPRERILVETDAPSMAPPAALNRFPLPPDAEGQEVQHPANLIVAYEGLSRSLQWPLEELCPTVEQNFFRLFH